MKENAVVQEIREELSQNTDHEYYDSVRKFFKEKVTFYGVRTSVVRKISAHYFSQIRKKPKEELFELCESLLQSGSTEERTIAFDWAFRIKKGYAPLDFSTFESWLKTYVKNWGSCDDLCTHALGEFIFQFPKFIAEVKKWTESENRWLRRASAVVLIYSIRRGGPIQEGFEIADILLQDGDDMVQKGYGWMLKEVSNLYPEKVFEYVMANKERMPRTSLRYAIEKLPPELKKKAMAKSE